MFQTVVFQPDLARFGQDRRAGQRVPLRRGAMLELPGRRRVAVNLIDLSEGGAALVADGLGIAPGTDAALMIDTALLPAIVVGVSADRVHLAFQALSPKAGLVLRRLLAGGLEPVADRPARSVEAASSPP